MLRFLHNLVKGRFLGHPIHPMLVHFPTALFTVSVLFDLIGTGFSEQSFFTASFYCIGAGLAGGVLAGVFGLIDYVRLAGNDRLFQKASLHALLQVSALMVFGVIFGLRYTSASDIHVPEPTELAVSGVAVLLMLAGNYQGGNLVFVEGVGVKPNATDCAGGPDG